MFYRNGYQTCLFFLVNKHIVHYNFFILKLLLYEAVTRTCKVTCTSFNRLKLKFPQETKEIFIRSIAVKIKILSINTQPSSWTQNKILKISANYYWEFLRFSPSTNGLPWNDKRIIFNPLCFDHASYISIRFIPALILQDVNVLAWPNQR